MKPKNHLRSCLLIFGVINLSACSLFSGPSRPETPDGSNRVPVNRATPQQIQARAKLAPSGTKPDASVSLAAQAVARSSFVLAFEDKAGKAMGGQKVRVSLFDTLTQISDNTGLRFVDDHDVSDEKLEITPTDDPFNVLRQLAQKSRYRISLDREKGRLWLSREDKKAGLFVLKDTRPVIQVGSPVTLKPMPKEPVSLLDAMRFLAPPDFDVGHAEKIDPNIHVDLSGSTSWTDGLERIALQTPYRIVFDWTTKMVYVVSVSKPLKGF